MAQWRHDYIKKNQTESNDDQTLYIDLPDNKQISFLELLFKCNPTSTGLYTRSFLDVIGTMEVVAGGKTIFSAPPEVASYFHFYQTGGQYPPHRLNDVNQMRLRFFLMFGRYPYDEEYGLDTGLYPEGVQLRIPYTLNTTYESTGTFNHTIAFIQPLEKLPWKGMIRSRVVHTYNTTGSAETKEVTLPTDLPWYHVGFRVDDIDVDPMDNITDVDFNIDDGELHLFDGRMQDLKVMNKAWWPWPIMLHFSCNAGDNTWVHSFLDYALGSQAIGSDVTLYSFNISVIDGERFKIYIKDDAGSAISSPGAYQILSVGSHPHSCFSLGKFDKDPFPIHEHDSAKIEYTIGAYSATIETFVQEVVTGAL